MKKIISFIISAVLCTAVFAGCGGGTEFDADAAVGQLMSAGIFAETLTEVKPEVTKKRLSLSEGDIESCTAYAGTKAVVDELVLVKASSPSAAETVESAFEKHIEAQKKSYSSYNPNEVPKLDSAVIVSESGYVILVVSADSDKAKSIIKDCLK